MYPNVKIEKPPEPVVIEQGKRVNYKKKWWKIISMRPVPGKRESIELDLVRHDDDGAHATGVIYSGDPDDLRPAVG